MSDPLGFINQPGPGARGIQGLQGLGKGGANRPVEGGGDFKQSLLEQIEQVNRLQQDAEGAKIGVATGEASLEQVITATETADTAFRMLLAVRNKLVDAYDEVKNIRV